MKKFFAGIILSLATVAALAMPRPSDIENALAAHDYQSAKSMTQEVLRERPDSARAHLLNAAVLLEGDHNREGAAAELKTARLLDKEPRNVSNSSLFGRIAAELERAPASPVQRYAPSQRRYEPATAMYTEVKPAGGSGIMAVLKFMFWATIIGLIVYFIYCIVRNSRQVVVHNADSYHPSWYAASEPLPAGGSLQPVYRNQGRTYDAPPHPVYPSAPAVIQPSTVVVHDNGMNNLMTGMMLNEAMHHHHHHDSYGHDRVIERETYVERDVVAAPAYQPSYPSDTTDYETTRSSYKSGSDDSWFSSSSKSSSSDNDWGSSSSSSSSSSDWGSSSSSDSSGGSWD
jgi:hypothetical protein